MMMYISLERFLKHITGKEVLPTPKIRRKIGVLTQKPVIKPTNSGFERAVFGNRAGAVKVSSGALNGRGKDDVKKGNKGYDPKVVFLNRQIDVCFNALCRINEELDVYGSLLPVDFVKKVSAYTDEALGLVAALGRKYAQKSGYIPRRKK